LNGAKLVAKVVIGVKFVDGEEQTDGIIVRLPMNAILCQTTCVTGGGSGIGQAVGVPLCAAGWTVIAGRKVETLDLSEPGNSLRALD
jgi:hypothetical protein